MCGITGFIDRSRRANQLELESLATRMATAIAHRGPDDSGAWADPEAGVALGHRRLSILDLSPLGHQPMFSVSGRYIIIFNGEIYNFRALRQQLETLGHAFRSQSDTEVMLAAITQWGVTSAIQRFNGMFAFALWDRQERTLYLTRDRMGEKPMYYGLAGDVFLFGSELKALRTHPAFNAEINRDALTLYLRHGYIRAPHSIYQGVFKLPAATVLALRTDQGVYLPSPQPYWSVEEAVERGSQNPFSGSAQEAVDELDALLRDAVKLRMESDVPLGAFLSGGIDSSIVVALMQAQSSRPVKTFSIGFHEDAFNEADHARSVAQHLATDHTELVVTPRQAMDVVPRLPLLYDEPFADSSQIPTFLVSQLARQHVTVSLSGDGGDELFAGYRLYGMTQNVWRTVGWMPPVARKLLSRGLGALSPENPYGSPRRAPGLPASHAARRLGLNVRRISDIIGLDKKPLYMNLISHWKTPERVVSNGHEPDSTILNGAAAFQRGYVPWMMYFDSKIYLPDDILVKVDRASMGVSLEGRVPLLDHRVVEFAWRLPMSFKFRQGKTKWLLRQALYRYVPARLVDRPKQGFGVPIDRWLQGPLRAWAEELLDESRVAQEGFFDPAPIRRMWSQHQAGEANRQYALWDILMFQLWLEHSRAPLAARD